MNTITKLDAALYPKYSTKNWDDRIFRERVLAVLKPDDSLLDLGAGAGIIPEMNFRDCVRQVHGLDPDQRVLVNPFLHLASVGFGDDIPCLDESVDCVIADNVLEHLDNPARVFREVARVLKPGGRFLFKTPNKFHYMPAIAMFTPTRFHQFVNQKRGREIEDTFPTRYRANSKRQVSKLASESGLTVTRIERIEGRPEYLRFSMVTYLLGWLYERIVNISPIFEGLRLVLIGELRKPD